MTDEKNTVLKLPDLQETTLVIFGITGDLAHRKLLPALYYLADQDLLPMHFRVVGVTRRDTTVKMLTDSIHSAVTAAGVRCDTAVLHKLAQMFEVVHMDLLKQGDYGLLHKRLNTIEDEMGVCMNRLFYLAIPAQIFGPVVERLGKGGLNTNCQHKTGASRLLIEKPFGYDLPSAHELIKDLNHHFSEEQIYRIDHYLAKETAQNILNFRFQNPLFRRVWDSDSIKSIMITAAETIDIEGRVAFYEQTGALRDFIQSHLLQLTALTTMEQPRELTSTEIHRQKLKLLKCIKPIAPNEVLTRTVRGQYEDYTKQVDSPESLAETYAALWLEIDNDRFRGVPILVRTGKALAEKVVDISIVFSDTNNLTHDNVLTIRIQPQEGISLQLLAKKPGFTNEVEPVQMDFCYERSFIGQNGHPDAYERVLMDAFRGDKTLFATSDEVITSWKILESVVEQWAKNDDGLTVYDRGSWGPIAANELATAAGTAWVTQDLTVCMPPKHVS